MCNVEDESDSLNTDNNNSKLDDDLLTNIRK